MDAADRLVRWERAGGRWRVLRRTPVGTLTIALDSCDGEEMSRLTADDAELRDIVGTRETSED